jgi:thioredoxin reductase (NADPH)
MRLPSAGRPRPRGGENYWASRPDCPGAELAQRSLLQAEKFRVNMSVPSRAVGLCERDGFHVVALEGGEELLAKVVLLALGVQYRRLPIEGLEKYEGNGVVYAVDVARGALPSDETAVVVGGANSAGQAALTLAEDWTPRVSCRSWAFAGRRDRALPA